MIFGIRKTPKIEFILDESIFPVVQHPAQAGKFVPNWFKKLEKTGFSSTTNLDKERETVFRKNSQTVKWCIPFLDAMTNGFIIPAWEDVTVIVERNKETQLLQANHFIGDKSEASLEQHPWVQLGDESVLNIDKPIKNILKLISPYSIKTTEGYSIRISSPSNGFHSNIHLFEGIVDTDAYHLPINFPFLWMGRKEGTFTIRKGTPIAQVHMFKREKQNISVSKISKSHFNKLTGQNYLLKSTNIDKYKTFFWHKSKKRIDV